MTFWSGETLLVKGPSLVRPFYAGKVDCNAITLTVGSEYYLTIDTVERDDGSNTIQPLKPRQWFCIPAGQFAFLITAESVRVPDDAMAFISMKSTTKFQGLVNISGFHVDPGYSGQLIFSVYNAGPAPVHICEGMPLFLIWFASLDQKTEYKKPLNSGRSGIDTDLIKGMNRPILSLQSMTERLDEVEKTLKVQGKLFGWGVAFVTALFISVISIAIRADISLFTHAGHNPQKGESAVVQPRHSSTGSTSN